MCDCHYVLNIRGTCQCYIAGSFPKLHFSSLMSLPNYSTLGVLNFGERVSVLQAEDYPLFSLCLELVWDAALADQGLRPRVTKVTMTSERVHALRGTTRRSVTRLVHQHSVEGSTMTGAELFYLCVNHFFHAEGDPSGSILRTCHRVP